MALPLVVGVDGSESSLLAVDWAVDEAARHDLPLRLVYASLWERYEGALPPGGGERPSEEVLAQHIVTSAADRAERHNPDVKVTTDIVPEDAAAALVRESDGAFALVTGSRGRGLLKGLLLGSVGLAVAARAHCPVVVVRGDRAGLAGTHGRIMLGLADADTGAEALRFAFREAAVRDCTLDIVRTWRHPAYGAEGDPLPADKRADADASALLDTSLGDLIVAHPKVRVHRSVIEGNASRILVDRSAASDLVIVGALRRTGRFGLQLGRVGHTLLHHAQCPVAVVPGRS
ncbi:universal stress protein [Streptomyces sp. 5-8]|uniref:Universal stress protein n=1 Tax=Streptomyces musisoli TaxID=2802280 RepID=A0ABS1PAC2_9ACTN|nr:MULTISPECIES: universal stress protein [Streptomyces]MBL1109015.1 universal stress protein [Streptomyces musisoli]MBY8845741.1 universal stress protein [Streptomyces sp. SP2-10]